MTNKYMNKPSKLYLHSVFTVYLGPFLVNDGESILVDRELNARMFLDWYASGTGHMTSSGCHATGFLATSIAKKEGQGDWPDIQYIYVS